VAKKLVGQNIAPPDLVAKITGRARFAEDFRADGMVFAKLLPSPMPHARVRRVDASRALAMEGVVGVLTADEVPQRELPAEPCLTHEPLYQGEPILAVAAVDETTAAAAIEAIDIDLEPLPFVLDPLDSLRPGGPDALLQGNVRVDRELRSIKWTERDFAAEAEGRLPMGEPTVAWSLGDVEAGFADAEVVIEKTMVHPSLTHHPLEPRSCMAYWQNGKLHLFGSTQSTQRTQLALARALDLEPEDVVFVGAYCGGGFGSKIAGSTIMQVPALLSRKIGRPVMLRITRTEETYIGRARPGFQAWARIGYRKDGRVTALDLYIVQDNGCYGSQGDYNTAAMIASLSYQPLSMRFRGISVYTNTPPRSAQRAPGGAQITTLLEPLMDEAARRLQMDSVALRKVNAPDAHGTVGPERRSLTSAYVREALDRGAEVFGWEDKRRLSGRREGTRVTGVGVALSSFVGGSAGFDGLVIIGTDGKLRVHQGIGNLGTHSFADTARVAADILGVPWKDTEIVWGDTSRGLPYSSVQAGSQTTHAHTRANHAAGMDARRKLQEIAARDLGGAPGDYVVAGGRVYRRGAPGRGMTLARAARRAVELGGTYDGHEVPDNLHASTVRAARMLAGRGLMGVARDTYPHEGSTFSFVAGFARIELDVETGMVEVKEYTAVTDCGIVVHPRSLAAQLHGGAVQGMGMARSQHWVIDPHWGVPLALRLYSARPPGILDVPLEMKWGAVGLPDPQTPVGAKGIGEPPIGAGAAVITSAVADALGGKYLARTPLSPDIILQELEGRGSPYGPLDTHV